MPKYNVQFIGRQRGATGITYTIRDKYECKDVHELMSLLYEDYDLIRGLMVERNNRDVEIPEKINWVKVRPNSERPRKADRATYA